MDIIIKENTTFAPPQGKRKLFAEGIIRIRQIPAMWTEAEYRYWWLPETDRGRIIRPARMSEREKEQYQIGEFRNAILNNGRTQILTFIGSSSGTTAPFCQYFAVGTGAISSVNPTDTTLANEVFRKAPASFAVNGTQVDINVQFGSTEAEYTYTNCGIWGVSATSTLGSGVLMTKAMCSFSKGAFGISVDYLINLL